MNNPLRIYDSIPPGVKPPFWRFLLTEFLVGLREVPWEPDRLWGILLIYYGIIFHFCPGQVLKYGYHWLAPVMEPMSWALSIIGVTHALAGVLDWRAGRTLTAVPALFIFSSFATNAQSPQGHGLFAIAAMSEFLIILKRY